MMQNRREFLKAAAFAALGSGLVVNRVFAGGSDVPSLFNVNSRAGVTPKMKLRFFPYELKLRHVFTVATYSRTTTPDIQVEIEYDGITAAAQFSPAVNFADLDGSLLIANDRFKGMEVVKGKITLPDLPGIGVQEL